MNKIICPVCWNAQWNSKFTAKERLIWTREEFSYGECVSCHAVFLLDKIKDFSPYYPEWYHCFDDERYPSRKKYLLRNLYGYNFWGKGIVWSITSKIFTKIHGHKPEQNICRIAEASKHILKDLNKHTIQWLSVLDLWCGSWWLLKQLQDVWFTNLTWVEPFWKPSQTWINFIESTVHDYVAQVQDKKYDIIILSHVLEHLYHHHDIIDWLKRMLSERWMIVIAMPFTWKLFNKYKEYRLSLDAPRHVIIHSIVSFRELIIKLWLTIKDEWYEQKWRDIFASEMYSRDIWFGEIAKLGLKDSERPKHDMIAKTYNQQREWWSSVTFFITH